MVQSQDISPGKEFRGSTVGVLLGRTYVVAHNEQIGSLSQQEVYHSSSPPNVIPVGCRASLLLSRFLPLGGRWSGGIGTWKVLEQCGDQQGEWHQQAKPSYVLTSFLQSSSYPPPSPSNTPSQPPHPLSDIRPPMLLPSPFPEPIPQRLHLLHPETNQQMPRHDLQIERVLEVIRIDNRFRTWIARGFG